MGLLPGPPAGGAVEAGAGAWQATNSVDASKTARKLVAFLLMLAFLLEKRIRS
jgi:hypothetical protein